MNTREHIRAAAIAQVVFLFALVQIACILYVANVTGMPALVFLGFSLAIHIILFIYLYIRRDDIRSLVTNLPFTQMNIANCLTTFRISCTPTFCYFCIVVFTINRFAPLLLVFAVLSTITDLLDGIISRKLKQTSYLGKHLDSIADYFLLISLTATYLYINFLPLYYVLIIAVRYLFQAIAALYLFFFRSTYTSGATLLGKITVFLLVFFLDFQLLRFFSWFNGNMHSINKVLQWLCTGMIGISFGERGYLFIHDIRRLEAKKHARQAKHAS